MLAWLSGYLMPLPLTVSCFCKSRLVLPFWYRLTRVVPERAGKWARACVCVCMCVRVLTYWLRMQLRKRCFVSVRHIRATSMPGLRLPARDMDRRISRHLPASRPDSRTWRRADHIPRRRCQLSTSRDILPVQPARSTAGSFTRVRSAPTSSSIPSPTTSRISRRRSRCRLRNTWSAVASRRRTIPDIIMASRSPTRLPSSIPSLAIAGLRIVVRAGSSCSGLFWFAVGGLDVEDSWS